MIQLVCIRAGTIPKRNTITGMMQDMCGSGLVENEKYTSTGFALSDEGHLCYKINELNGDVKLVERFTEIPTYTITEQTERKNAIKK